ncbi:hypothetical protein F5144DRAFT_594543 [Chaetomium tenue]|uniref:Uncharacterized protein n=1 Tax=Chaetomium tenue TaxID=1854479 RepID=A0ACB7P3B7_9PEZI|nr:hypothetical protein F5144DRAFT_594543 [Chaetomium globosum]
MQLTSLSLLAAWSALALASLNVGGSGNGVGQSEFHLGVILPRQQSRTNLQVFSGALGGTGASAITNSGDPERPFEVDGDTFRDYDTAANRACDNQKNACADIANNRGGAFEVGDCDQQTEQCKSSASSATIKTFGTQVLVSSDEQFDYFCEV